VELELAHHRCGVNHDVSAASNVVTEARMKLFGADGTPHLCGAFENCHPVSGALEVTGADEGVVARPHHRHIVSSRHGAAGLLQTNRARSKSLCTSSNLAPLAKAATQRRPTGASEPRPI